MNVFYPLVFRTTDPNSQQVLQGDSHPRLMADCVLSLSSATVELMCSEHKGIEHRVTLLVAVDEKTLDGSSLTDCGEASVVSLLAKMFTTVMGLFGEENAIMGFRMAQQQEQLDLMERLGAQQNPLGRGFNDGN